MVGRGEMGRGEGEGKRWGSDGKGRDGEGEGEEEGGRREGGGGTRRRWKMTADLRHEWKVRLGVFLNLEMFSVYVILFRVAVRRHLCLRVGSSGREKPA